MAIKINFQNGEYNEDSFNDEFGAIVGKDTKIVVGENSFKVTQANPLANKVTVSSGEAFINKKYITSDSNTTLVVENNLSGSTRRDIVVLELTGDNTPPALKVIKGTTSAPNPTQTQLLLAEIVVINNSLSIADKDIVERRNLGNTAVSDSQKLGGYKSEEFLRKEEVEVDYGSNQWSFNFFGKFTVKCGYDNNGVNSNGKNVVYSKPYKEGCYVVVPVLIPYQENVPTNISVMIKGNWSSKTGFTARTSSSSNHAFMWISIGK